VRHACKLLSLAYKRRGNPPAAGGRQVETNDILTPLVSHSDIGTCLNQYLWDLEDQPPLPPRL
jgi:hypothetical protein